MRFLHNKRVIKGYEHIVFLITLYNPFNLAAFDSRKCFTTEIGRILTYINKKIHR